MSGANTPTESERQSLLMIRELINSKLGMTSDGILVEKSIIADEGEDVPNVNTPPSSVVLKAENNDSVPDEPSRISQEDDDHEMLL